MKRTAPSAPARPAAHVLALAALALLLALGHTHAARAQWTQPAGSSNVYKTDAGGNVGIGTSAPAEKLHVPARVRFGNMLFGESRPGGVEPSGEAVESFGHLVLMSAAGYDIKLGSAGLLPRVVINSAGNVGVGTSSPSTRLHVFGGGITVNPNNSSTDFGFLLTGNLNGSTAGGWGRGMTLQPTLASASSNTAIIFQTAPAIGANVAQGSFFSASIGNPTLAGGASITTNYGLYLENQTAGSTNYAIYSAGGQNYFAGNVGVGTAAPSQKLHVFGGHVFHQFSSAGGQEYGFYTALRNNHFTSNVYFDGQWRMMTAGQGAFIATGPLDGVALSVAADNTPRAAHAPASFSSLMRVNMNGNVGVGTDAPAHRLDVAGSVNGSGLCIAGECKTSWAQVGGGSSQWASGGTAGSIFYNAGSVGIGTPSPSASRLHLYSGAASTYLRIGAPLAHQSAIAFDDDTHGQDVVLYRPEGTRDFSVWTVTAGQALNITQAGGVGIGTATPNASYKLDVNGGANVTGNFNATGTITGGNISAKYQDVAEWVPTTQELQAGTVVILDPARSNHVLASGSAYDTSVAGVVSAQPGLILGEGGEGKVMVATTGRVRVRVDATKGPIKIGDLLVTSNTPGVAMRSEPIVVGGRPIHAPGTIIGKALEPLAGGVGEILVLLSMQ